MIHSVEYALDILDQFNGDVDEIGVTELSKRMQLSKNKVFRLLATLESHNYIEQNKSTAYYRLGVNNLQLSQTAAKHMGLMRQTQPVLKSLTHDSNETSYVAILKGSDIVYLDTMLPSRAVRVMPRIGAELPAYCTAVGKVLLAGAIDMKPLDFTALAEFQQYTPNTITDRHEFKKHLETIVTRGYAMEDEEFDVGVSSIAAPIRDFTKCVVGAICVSGPTTRFNIERKMNVLVPMVKKAAEKISHRVGYSPPYSSAICA